MLFKSSTTQALEKQLADYKDAYEREAQTNLKLMEERKQLLAQIEKLKAEGNTAAALSEELARVQQQLAESQLELAQMQKIHELQAYEDKTPSMQQTTEAQAQEPLSPIDEMWECIAQLEAQNEKLAGASSAEPTDIQPLDVQPTMALNIERGNNSGGMPEVCAKPKISACNTDIQPFVQPSMVGEDIQPFVQPSAADLAAEVVQPLMQGDFMHTQPFVQPSAADTAAEVAQPKVENEPEYQPPVIPELTPADEKMLEESLAARTSLCTSLESEKRVV